MTPNVSMFQKGARFEPGSDPEDARVTVNQYAAISSVDVRRFFLENPGFNFLAISFVHDETMQRLPMLVTYGRWQMNAEK